MKILILTGSFGMGHNSVAKAINEELSKKDYETEVVDIVEYIMPVFNKIIYNTFNITANKMQGIYNAISSISDKTFFQMKNKIATEKVRELIKSSGVDLVISTLPLSSRLVSDYKEEFNDNIPLITCITDISWHKEWLSKKTDYYCVGDKALKKKLIYQGIPEKVIFVTGIPVKSEFLSIEKIAASNVDKEMKKVLIMGGGLGIIPVNNQILSYLNKRNDVEVTIITGKNINLYKDLKDKYSKFNIVGYTEKVREYMVKADILISKAGGITMYEAINSELPLLIVNPFLKQEIDNAHFIDKKGIGKVIWQKNVNISEEVEKFINDKDNLNEIRGIMRNIKKEIAKESIGILVDNICEEMSVKVCG